MIPVLLMMPTVCDTILYRNRQRGGSAKRIATGEAHLWMASNSWRRSITTTLRTRLAAAIRYSIKRSVGEPAEVLVRALGAVVVLVIREGTLTGHTMRRTR